MVTYICNICKKEVVQEDAYIVRMHSGPVKDKWAICPNCWSYILLHANEIAVASQGEDKFERRTTITEIATVEPEIEAQITSNSELKQMPQAKVSFTVYTDKKRLTPEAKEYIVTKYKANDCSYKSIADDLGISVSTVYSIVNRYNTQEVPK